MSSSNAINRRIQRDTNMTQQESFTNNFQGENTQPNTLSGTTSQQHYQILNFHERRLNQVFEQVHVLTASLKKLEPDVNVRLYRLEQENASLRKHMASLMATISSTSSNNSMSLNINENES